MAEQAHHLRTEDRFLGPIVAAIGCVLFIFARHYHSHAEIFPKIVSILLVLGGAALFVRSFTNSPSAPREEPQSVSVLAGAILLGAGALYAFLMTEVGFLTATSIFVPITAYACGLRKWKWIVFGTVAYVALAWLVFIRMFDAQLPRELIMRLF
jgi:hypothetical protein